MNESLESVKNCIKDIADSGPQISEYGTVKSIRDGIIDIDGLKDSFINEFITVNSKNGDKIPGMIISLYYDLVSAVTFGGYTKIGENDEVIRSKKSISVGVGYGLLGRVVNPLCTPIDGKGDIKFIEYREIETPAPEIITRKSVTTPLQTGIKLIDSIIPIGRGQRELIIGDRKTGKTTIAIDAIINQAKINKTLQNDQDKVYSVYVAIGQKKSTVANIVAKLEEAGAMEYTTIVATFASDDAALQYISPYAGCSIAEYYRDNGKHALVVYDDLSKHAVAYRQMSLLLKRPSGREAYPGDVFYIHSKLLERASQLSDDRGGGSLTALPIIETQDSDVSAYIPTNVISITDGQIFLEKNLFFKGQLPAVNVGLSVSRIGSSAQTKIIKKLAGTTKLELAQYRELEQFARFSSDLDENTKTILSRGEKIIELLKQKNGQTFSVAHQSLVLYFVYSKKIDKYTVSEVRDINERIEHFFALHDLNQDRINRVNSLIHDNDFNKQEVALGELLETIIENK